MQYYIFPIARNVEARVRLNKNYMVQSSRSPNAGDGNQNTVNIEEFEIKISSSILCMDQLRVLINDWLNEYQEYKAPNKHLRFFLYR